jgi:hypothetical protein
VEQIIARREEVNVMRLYTIAVTTGLLLVGAARPEEATGKELKPTRQWSGSVDDEALQKQAPQQGFITDTKAFTKLWRAWKVGEKVEAVDFTKELVLVATTSGSRLDTTARLTAEGDLRVLSMATADFMPGFRYQIVLVPRESVKTVNGKRLAKDQ